MKVVIFWFTWIKTDIWFSWCKVIKNVDEKFFDKLFGLKVTSLSTLGLAFLGYWVCWKYIKTVGYIRWTHNHSVAYDMYMILFNLWLSCEIAMSTLLSMQWTCKSETISNAWSNIMSWSIGKIIVTNWRFRK